MDNEASESCMVLNSVRSDSPGSAESGQGADGVGVAGVVGPVEALLDDRILLDPLLHDPHVHVRDVIFREHLMGHVVEIAARMVRPDLTRTPMGLPPGKFLLYRCSTRGSSSLEILYRHFHRRSDPPKQVHFLRRFIGRSL